MAQDASRLIWVDLEMTGLDPDTDRIIEVALVITDQELTPIAHKVAVVHQPHEVLDAMDRWNKTTHERSGLTAKVRASTADEAAVETDMLAFLATQLPATVSPMCGNSVCQDRRFMARHMKRLESYFHYRNLDVSTLKELARLWRPDVFKGLVKQGRHEALADIEESIEELKYYRQHFLRAGA
jgi:oligoribonuclease